MNDINIIKNLLILEKASCDLYMHGTLESSTKEMHNEFKKALDNSIEIQNELYNKMAEKGWYNPEKAETEKIESTKSEFSS